MRDGRVSDMIFEGDFFCCQGLWHEYRILSTEMQHHPRACLGQDPSRPVGDGRVSEMIFDGDFLEFE